MATDYNELENWSVRVAEALQEICDEAQEAAGKPDGENECIDLRMLLHEHSKIMLGEPLWQDLLIAAASDEEPALLVDI